MRKAFFRELEKIMDIDKNVCLLTDDLGYSFIEKVQVKFPDRVTNCGVMEQTMIGIAAGLAIEGKKPYCYGTIPFIIMRPYEQVRDDVCYQNLNVKLIGTSHSGFLGFTHNLEKKENEEDLLKNLPNIERYYPKDELELKKAMIESYQNKKPSYIKL